jgi:uncharacterized protein
LDPIERIAEKHSIAPAGVRAVVALLKEGGTVPFIARYRKEATGGLDEVQIRAIEERHGYLTELEARKKTVLEEIERQGKLTDELRARIEACDVKTDLEDLYLPYKPKRRTRAMIAREKGLEPLAQRILAQGDDGDPAREAEAFVDAESLGVGHGKEALQGARDIVAELIAESAAVRAWRASVPEGGVLVVTKASEVTGPTKFESTTTSARPARPSPRTASSPCAAARPRTCCAPSSRSTSTRPSASSPPRRGARRSPWAASSTSRRRRVARLLAPSSRARCASR